MLAARVLKTLFSPTKLNYEIHGNTIPHLHLHLFPRYAADPYVGGPIDFRQAGFSRAQVDLERMREAFVKAFDEGVTEDRRSAGPSARNVP